MIITDILQLIRIKDWFKNLIIFFPLIFTGRVLEYSNYLNLIICFLIFSFSASIIYILNDIIDFKNDSNHPIKKNRPIASRRLSIKNSIFLLILFTFLVFLLLIINHSIFLHIMAYILSSVLYIIILKHIPVFEILVLSFFYIIRIDSGSHIINVESSVLMLLTTFTIAIFFILLKRIGELNLKVNQFNNNTRYVLKFYNIQYLRFFCILFVILFFIFMCRYIYVTNYYLIFTLPFITLFMYRYYNLSINTNTGENPISLILNDNTLIFQILISFLLITLILIF